MIKPQQVLFILAMLFAGGVFAADPAGTVKRVTGAVEVERGQERLPATPGMLVYASDKIHTGADGAVGLTLRDETLLSVGANSVFGLDKFDFDQTTHEGVLETSLKRGKLAVQTGKLAKEFPEAVKFSTPNSILGVRGTEFVVEVKE